MADAVPQCPTCGHPLISYYSQMFKLCGQCHWDAQERGKGKGKSGGQVRDGADQ